MSKVLIAVSADWRVRLAESVLSRNGVERFTAPDAAAAVSMARALRPRLVVFDAADPQTLDALRRLREMVETRAASLAVLAQAPSDAARDELMHAGANSILTEAEGPALWDDRFDELLGVPPRREVRVPVAITIWSRREAAPGADVVGVSVNISVSGLLIETRSALAVGSTINLSFRLPSGQEDDELRLMGRVVWTTPVDEDRYRSGIEFLGFHGRAMEAILRFSVGFEQPAS